MEGRIEDTLLQNQINAAGGGGGGTPLITQESGVTVEATTTIMNFTGAGVAVTNGGSGEAVVTIAGGGGGTLGTGFSPLCIGAATGGIGADEGKLYLTEAEHDMTITKCTVWSALDGAQNGEIQVSLYRWNTGWGTGALMGTVTTDPLSNPGVYGPNDLTFVADPAETI